MRFALLGDHADGIEMARALVASARHAITIYSGPPAGFAQLTRHGIEPRRVGDLEAVLADAEVDAVIVASGPSLRPAQLRRALQSEHHVLCVHPADASPDAAYEAALIQSDTGRILLPLLPAALHPGIARFAQLARRPESRLIELEIWSNDDLLLDSSSVDKPALPGWEVLRLISGEIGEIYAQTSKPELAPGDPVLVSGRFLSGKLLQATFLPNQAESRWRLSCVTSLGRASLVFPQGFPGHAVLTYVNEQGEMRIEEFVTFDPWTALVECFESALASSASRRREPGRPDEMCLTKTPPQLGWQDEIRALELDDAARRSAERGRSSTLDYQEATEEASFKGTMTLAGCSLIWLAVVLLILSVWLPWVAWGILPLFSIFLVMQILRWVVPTKENGS